MNELIIRDVEKLWNKYEGLLGYLKSDNITKLLDMHGQRIAECSYSQKTSEVFCGIGGILEYSLELAKTAKIITTGHPCKSDGYLRNGLTDLLAKKLFPASPFSLRIKIEPHFLRDLRLNPIFCERVLYLPIH